MTERFITGAFREESLSLTDVVDAGLGFEGCSCSCSCGGRSGGGGGSGSGGGVVSCDVGFTFVDEVVWEGGSKGER